MKEKNKGIAIIAGTLLIMASINVAVMLTISLQKTDGEEENQIDISYLGIQHKTLVSGGYLYVLGNRAIVIFNIVDENNPIEISRVNDSGSSRIISSFFVSGNWLFVGTETGIMRIVDISDKENPRIISSCYTSGKEINAIVTDGNYSYLAHDTGLAIINISQKDRPVLVAEKKTGGEGSDAIIENDVLFLTDSTDGLIIFDVSNRSDPTILEIFHPISGEYRDLARYKNTLYCQVERECILVFDVSDPRNPEETRRISVLVRPKSMGVIEDKLFIGNDDELKVFIITNPNWPKYSGAFKVNEYPAENFSGDGNHVYITQDESLSVYELNEGIHFLFWVPLLIVWIVAAMTVLKQTRKNDFFQLVKKEKF